MFDRFSQRRAPANTQTRNAAALEMPREKLSCCAPEKHRNKLGICGRGDDDRGLQRQSADKLLFEVNAARERRIQRDADNAIRPRLGDHAIDAQSRQAQALGDFALSEPLHEIEPRDAYALLLVDLTHRASST